MICKKSLLVHNSCVPSSYPVKLIKNDQDSPAAGAKLEAGGGAPKFEGGAEPAAAEDVFIQ